MAEPRYETAYELSQRLGRADTVICTDCGVFVMDRAAHTRFHALAEVTDEQPPGPEMPARLIERLGRWPDEDEPGRFVVRCSCRRWTFTGTAAEIAAAGRGHDDSPFRHHVVHIWGKVAEPS